MTRIITIASGKGGVGKSILALNLALLLQDQGRRTCLLDADLGLANVNILLGLEPQLTIEDVIILDTPLRDVILATPDGLDIITGGHALEDIANLDQRRVAEVVAALSTISGYDDLIIDTAAGISPRVTAFCLAATELILTVTPDPTSLVDALALLKVLRGQELGRTVLVVVNLCPDRETARRTFARLRDPAREYLGLELQPLGLVVDDPAVPQSVKRQRPLVRLSPQAPASRCLGFMARRLAEMAQIRPADLDMGDFWNRYVTLLNREPEPAAGEPIDPDREPEEDTPASPNEPLWLAEPTELPCLPQILAAMLNELDRLNPALDRLIQLAALDPVLAFHLVTRRAADPDGARDLASLARAASGLGPAGIRAVVEGLAARAGPDRLPVDGGQGLRDRWMLARHSRHCAALAFRAARILGAVDPEEAFTAALFHDLGRLTGSDGVAPDRDDALERHSPENQIRTHPALAAAWLEARDLCPLTADALRYHHQPVDRAREALPLAQAVHLAESLTVGEDRPIRQWAAALGRPEGELRELSTAAEDEAVQALSAWGLASQAARDLALAPARSTIQNRARILARLAGIFQSLAGAASQAEAMAILRRELAATFGLRRTIFFHLDPERAELTALADPTNGTVIHGPLTMPLSSGGSLLAQALTESRVVRVLENDDLAGPGGVEEELRRFWSVPILEAWPLSLASRPLGLLVLGLGTETARSLDREPLLPLVLARHLSQILAAWPQSAERPAIPGSAR